MFCTWVIGGPNHASTIITIYRRYLMHDLPSQPVTPAYSAQVDNAGPIDGTTTKLLTVLYFSRYNSERVDDLLIDDILILGT